MIKIFIVEDDKNIREIEAFSLKNSGYEIEEFPNAAEFYKRLEEEIPKLIVLDLMLPDDDGLNIVAKLRKDARWKKIPIILVTAKTTEMDKVRGFEIGADDYLTKPFGVMELISRVKALLRRTMDIEDERTLEFFNIVMDTEKHLVKVDGEQVELTYKEFQLLKLFLRNVGIVMNRDTIMVKIWGTEYEGESRTLDMHIKTLRQKMGSSGNRIKTIRNVGYVLE
ncbi:response regulator transcription factor [Lachnospiraceae bacterium HCP1S3_C3]|nr:response regulator transcription factor [Lachnospiraceae bacterium]MDD6858073.1 response regulator transcription factor [Lachnospiraceae bacterium]